MSYTKRKYRTNLSMKGLVFLNGKELECIIVDLSTNGIKMEITPGHYFNNAQLFLDAINISGLVNFAIPEMHLDGESKIIRKESDGNKIYLSLAFSDVYYGLEHIPYKRKFYRTRYRAIGHIKVSAVDYEVISQNISLSGMLIASPDPITVNNGEKITIDFKQVNINGDAEVIWSKEVNKKYLIGVKFIKLAEAVKGIASFER